MSINFFALIAFVVGQTLFMWAATAIIALLNLKSETMESSSFDSGLFFVVNALARLLHICV